MSQRRLVTQIPIEPIELPKRKRRARTVALFLLACGPVMAQALSPVQSPVEPTNQMERAERRLHRNRALWLVSIPVFLAANVLDAQSSWGKAEQNPLLRGQSGRFDGRSAAIKFGISAGVIGGEYSLIRLFRKNHESQPGAYASSAWSNFVGAGVLAGAAVHNYHTHPADTSNPLK